MFTYLTRPRNWLLAAGTLFVVAVSVVLLGAAANPAQEPEPPVSALIRSQPQGPGLFADPPKVSKDELQTHVGAQVTLIKSQPVLRAALKDDKVRGLPVLKMQPDPVAWLQKHLTVRQVEEGPLIRVSLAGAPAGESATIINAVTGAYFEVIVKAEYNRKLAFLCDLDKVYHAAQDKLREQREALRRLGENLKIGGEVANTRLAWLREEHRETMREQLRLELARVAADVRLKDAEAKKLRDEEATRQELQILDQQLRLLRTRATELAREVEKRAASSVDLEMKKKEIEGSEKVCARLRERMDELHVELQMTTSRPTYLVAPAEAAAKP
jgi:hypothetical protein